MTNLRVLVVKPPSIQANFEKMFPHNWFVFRVNTIELALKKLQRAYLPDLIFINSSFSLNKSLKLLESIKNLSKKRLIPIVITLDFSDKIIQIPGTAWGGKMGILYPQCSLDEFTATLNRIL